MVKRLLTVLLLLLIVGCDKGKREVIERNEHYCDPETSNIRADFILKCIKNANPKSDEEPEDWIIKCEDIAERTLCPMRRVKITMECISDLGCGWVEVDRQVTN